MAKIVDARGLACPEPVVLTKKALQEAQEVLVMVDDTTAVENITRLGTSMGCTVETEIQKDRTFRIRLSRSSGAPADADAVEVTACCDDERQGRQAAGPLVIAISSDRMGRGEDELGSVLIRSFIHTLLTLEPRPDILLFYNTGVKLTVRDSVVIDDLRELEAKGDSLLICGTCINFFDLKEQIGAGKISNMYDIASTMAIAGRLIMP